MEKFKILHITTDSKLGGAEQMLLSLAQNYDRNKYEHIFVIFMCGGELLTGLEKAGCRSYCLNIASKFDFYKVFNLFFIIKKEKPDIVNTYLYHGDQFGRIFAKLAGAPVIISSYRSPDFWKKKYHTIIDRFTARFADCFTSNSEMAKKTVVMREKIPAEKIRVINNGIIVNEKPATIQIKTIKNDLGIESYKKIIGITANHTAVKNYGLFIDICAILNNEFDNLQFVSIGDGPERNNIEKYAEFKNVKNIVFLGARPDVREILPVFDIFILTSKWESSSRALLEAMAAGIPAVAANVGGLPELIDDSKSGFLCGHSAIEFAEKISLLLKDEKLYAKISENALKRVKEKFSLEYFIKELHSFYEEVSNKNKIK